MEDQTPTLSSGRRHPRYPISLPISVSREEPGESQADTALLRDLSLTGFCFASAKPYALESRLNIQITFGEREYRIKALVQRCNEAPTGITLTYAIAVLFLRGGDIHAFIADIATYLNRLPTDLAPV